MFFLKLYKYSKGLFFLFAGFLLAFVFINAKQGAVATPVYQYGMFSESFLRGQRYEAYQFIVDGEAISLKNLCFPARDIMLVSLQNYLKSSENNKAVHYTMKRFIGSLVSLPASVSETALPQTFNIWYFNMVSKLLKKKISSLDVFRGEVSWKDGIRVEVSSQKIFPLAE